jgi:hypothetical protein
MKVEREATILGKRSRPRGNDVRRKLVVYRPRACAYGEVNACGFPFALPEAKPQPVHKLL